MDFTTYFKSLDPDVKKRLADRADTSVDYLRQISRGERNAGFQLIVKLLNSDPNITISMFDSSIAA